MGRRLFWLTCLVAATSISWPVTPALAASATVASAATSTTSAFPAVVLDDGSEYSTISVVLRDASDLPVSGKAVSLTAGSGSSSISVVSGVSDAQGLAEFRVRDAVAETVLYTPHDTTDGVDLAGVTVGFEPVAGVSRANSTMVVSPSSAPADGSTLIAVTVTLRDGSRTPLGGMSVSLAQSGGATVVPGSATTDSTGTATFAISDTHVESVALAALIGGVGMLQQTVSFTSGATVDDDLALSGVPADIAVAGTGSGGALVSYTPPVATDEDAGTAAVSCDRASGSLFPIGTTTVTCTASDSDDAHSPVSASFTVSVSDSDLGLANLPAGLSTTATGPAGAIVNYTAPAALDEDNPGSAVSCFPASGATFPVGITTVTCTATDADDAPPAVSGTFTVTVLDAPPAAQAGGPYTGFEGVAISIGGSATDIDGQIVSSSWAVTSSSNNDPGATCVVAQPNAVSTSVTCNDDGTYALTLSVIDNAGLVATASSLLTVFNAAPVVGSISGLPTGPIAIHSTAQPSVSFTDPGSLDSHTASWSWGDGSTSSGAVTEASGSGSVTGSHAYAAAGVFTVTVTVTDADGAGAGSAFEFVVVYDGSAGFVTGGGWFTSPAGAYRSMPAATGKASFGFVSRYQNGATVPTGNTRFQFQAGSLDFHSTAYQWMVIAGNCRVQFKGTGTINGSGSFTFMLTAVDGERCSNSGADTFRIQIMDNLTGATVYDNGTDQPIGGGDIQLHS